MLAEWSHIASSCKRSGGLVILRPVITCGCIWGNCGINWKPTRPVHVIWSQSQGLDTDSRQTKARAGSSASPPALSRQELPCAVPAFMDILAHLEIPQRAPWSVTSHRVEERAVAQHHAKTIRTVGLDFGTTNSALAVVCSDGTVQLSTFQDNGQVSTTFRSVLYFSHPEEDDYGDQYVMAGPQAIRSYLRADPKGRFMQSIKSFLASRLFERTHVFTRLYTLEDLIAIIVRALRTAAEAQFGDLGTAVVVGRPVHFAGAQRPEDEALALQRLRTALHASGFDQVTFEFEPVAAAYAYGQQLERAEVVLIADCGGGTSDLSLLKITPSRNPSMPGTYQVLGTDGVAIGGDIFDSMLVRHLVAPQLGWGISYRALDKLLPVPNWLYSQLERWDHLWFLNTRSTLELLRTIRSSAAEPQKIDQFLHLITHELGYPLSKAVETTKFALTTHEASRLVFQEPPVALHEGVARQTFETWIHPSLQAIEACIDRLLDRCQMASTAVDCVFLTGGSSFVPAIRDLFARKFDVTR